MVPGSVRRGGCMSRGLPRSRGAAVAATVCLADPCGLGERSRLSNHIGSAVYLDSRPRHGERLESARLYISGPNTVSGSGGHGDCIPQAYKGPGERSAQQTGILEVVVVIP